MPKKYVVSLVVEYEPDENNYLNWEDEYQIEDKDKGEDFVARTEQNLITILRREVVEMVANAIDIYNLFSVEVEEVNKQETYTITKLDTWDDHTWAFIIQAVEDTVASYGEDGNG
jgi:hypothetical protein